MRALRGVMGELVAERYLTRRGYSVVARNWRTKLGELDLILSDDRCLLFVEVKARSSSSAVRYDPLINVTQEKGARLRRLAEEFVRTHFRASPPPFRIDLVGVALRDGDVLRSSVRHVEAAE